MTSVDNIRYQLDINHDAAWDNFENTATKIKANISDNTYNGNIAEKLEDGRAFMYALQTVRVSHEVVMNYDKMFHNIAQKAIDKIGR